MIEISWNEMKSLIANGYSYSKINDKYGNYHVNAVNGPIALYSVLDLADKTDYDDNYASGAANNLELYSQGNPFASKKLPNGKKIFLVDNTKSFSVLNASQNLDFKVPLSVMKINGLELIGCKAGDKATLQVLDDSSGTISGVPDYVLKTFGKVHLPDGFYRRVSKYDADLIGDMTIRVIYERKEQSPDDSQDVYINYLLHEVK